MERISCHEGRWSIGLCACSEDTVHFHYGNATLHILVEDIRELGNALQQLAERLQGEPCRDGRRAKNKDLMQ
ncbi:MAG TPA: hypothetical protein VNL14_12755 [Candidatus Acidoferrales bacterium]|nr:hypothetical protein [Candidatus Acidoferrales bacterium]